MKRQPYTVELTEDEVYELYALLAWGLLAARAQEQPDSLSAEAEVARRVRDVLRPAVVARRVEVANAIIDGTGITP